MALQLLDQLLFNLFNSQQSSMPLPTINTSSLSKYAKAILKCDLSKLTKNQQTALIKLREATVLMDEIFMYQSTGKSLTEWKELISSEYKNNNDNNNYMNGISKEDYLRFITLNMGPWDRLSDDVHDQKENPKAKGVNYYPKDITTNEFNNWVNTLNDNQKIDAKSFFTVIKRNNNSLKYISYNNEYEKWLKPASKLLIDASNLVGNVSLKKYLSSRADAFLSNNYIESDIDWLNIDKESDIDITIGPYEVYEDELLNLKAAFESFICLTDKDNSSTLQLFANKLQELENNLPIDDQYKNQNVVQGTPIIVVDEICIGGDRGGPQTAAFNLPNDERVTSKHGHKLVILRNIQQAKFEKVLTPITEIVIDPSQRKYVTFSAFFNHILCHEMCHSLGPHKLDPNKFNGASTVRECLGKLHSAIEEAKADIAGLYSLLYLINLGLFNSSSREEVLVSFLSSCFRSIRFGLGEAHGKGIAIQLNWIMEKGGFIYNNDNEYFSVDFNKCDEGIKSLTKKIIEIQATGDVVEAKKLCDQYGINKPMTVKALQKLKEKQIPVDIQPYFEWTGLID